MATKLKVLKLRTLKSKLIAAFSLVLASFSIMIVMYYSYYTNNLLINQTIQNASTNTGYLLSVVDQQMKSTEELSDWVYINRDIDMVLIRDYSRGDYNFNRDISAALKTINNRLSSSSIGKYVTSFIIWGRNNIKVTVGPETDYIDLDSLFVSPWFIKGINSHILDWPGIEVNLSKMKESDYSIPISRSIIFADSRKPIGWQFIAFSPDLIGDTVKGFDIADGDSIFVLDKAGRCVYSNLPGYQGSSLKENNFFSSIAGMQGHQMTTYNGKRYLAVYEASSYSGLQIVQLLDHKYISLQSKIALQIALIVLAVITIIGMVTTVFLSKRITQPLSKLLEQIGIISAGDFRPSPEIEGDDEFGILGKGMNSLSSSVSQLMNQVKEDEKKKHELEFKVLQNQINPHFIYNVINSIKVMAMIQKSDGIYKTATSLGALLKETSKGNRDFITIAEELDLLEKYIEIQKIRKSGLIMSEYNVEEELDQYTIPRFTLQPIVENAIIHGFEGKRGMGIIEVTVKSANDEILIEVKDNGLGISEDKLSGILTEDELSETTYNKVGLKNINERLKLIYGEKYGLSITSKESVYTSVSILIPKSV